jgi:TrpR family trp operon transcriptional repressor
MSAMRTKHTVDERVFERVAGILASIESPDEMSAFLERTVDTGEVRDITLRWRLLERLSEGVTQRRIAEELRISLCKITRGSKILKQQGAVTTRLLELRQPAGCRKRGGPTRVASGTNDWVTFNAQTLKLQGSDMQVISGAIQIRWRLFMDRRMFEKGIE